MSQVIGYPEEQQGKFNMTAEWPCAFGGIGYMKGEGAFGVFVFVGG